MIIDFTRDELTAVMAAVDFYIIFTDVPGLTEREKELIKVMESASSKLLKSEIK